ncbi:MAG TPA: heme-degrading domain-containing protein [Clostridiales bacterium]|jgi:uncharacterized protein (UPF0303 family)|nr:heme-degrading domain-containing protein [Clostridiales bacterium]
MLNNEHEDNLLKKLMKQEETLVFDTFSLEMAHEIGERLYQKAYERRLPVAIDITRCGQQLYHAALPGSTADNDAWILRKSRVVMRFGQSSYYWGAYLEHSKKSMEEDFYLSSSEYAPHGGSFPITLRNTGVIGTITVSGLPSEEDHALVVEVLEEYLILG